MKVQISVPCARTPDPDFTLDLIALGRYVQHHMPDVTTGLEVVMGSILLQNRFELVRRAQKWEADFILWLDDDQTFPADTLVRLLAAKKDFIGANVVTRVPPIRPLAVKNGKHLRSFGRTGLEDNLDSIGLGVCLTSMRVFQKVAKPWFYFGWAPKAEEFIGEDVWLCRAARQQGFNIWCDHDLSNEVGHMGRFEFRQDLVDLFDTSKPKQDIAHKQARLFRA